MEVFEFGPFRVDVVRRSLERAGEPVAVTGKGFETLVVLLEHRGETVEKDDLMRLVWPDTIVEENNITVAVSAVRKALGESSTSPKWIITIPGRGYRFAGEVKAGRAATSIAVISGSPTAASVPIALVDSPAQSPSVSPEAGNKDQARDERVRRLYTVVLPAVLVVALATWGLFAWRGSRSSAPKPLRSVAILPFNVLNRDPKNEYLGLGLTDTIITRLESMQLPVRPLASVSRFANHDPFQSGRELGVEAIVDGSVQTTDAQIRVSVRLLRVSDDKPLWAESFEVASNNAFAIEDSIAERVATNLTGPLTGQQQTALNKRSTVSPTAYANYLKGRYYAATYYDKEGYDKAQEYLKKAIEEDPTYAMAYSGLADSYYDASNLLFAPNEVMPKAKAAAQKAVELDPSLAMAHVSLGIVASKYDWDWQVAEHEFQTALAQDPSLATAHLWYGLFRAQSGDFDHAIAELRRAQELDPLSGEINAYLEAVLYWARRYDESVEQLRQAIRFNPSFFPNYVILCWAQDAKGDTIAALDACKQGVEHQGIPWTMLVLARAEAVAGDRSGATATVVHFSTQSDAFVSGYDRAAVYVALGKNDEAFAALEEGFQSHAEWMAYLKVDPQMDPLRHDARYGAIVKRLGL